MAEASPLLSAPTCTERGAAEDTAIIYAICVVARPSIKAKIKETIEAMFVEIAEFFTPPPLVTKMAGQLLWWIWGGRGSNSSAQAKRLEQETRKIESLINQLAD